MSQNMELDAAIASAIFDPGAEVGMKHDRTLSRWQTDAVMNVLDRFALTATRPDAGDLVSRLRERLYEHWLVSVDCDHEAKTDIATCSCSQWRDVPHPSVGEAVKAWIDHALSADFISRLSTAPAGDVVRDLSRMDWHGLEEVAESLAPTPSPQTSPATEGEPIGVTAAAGLQNLSLGFSASVLPISLTDEIFNVPVYLAPPPAKAGEGEVRVKALEWEAAHGLSYKASGVAGVACTVRAIGNGMWQAEVAGTVVAKVMGHEAAKSAAQKHYTNAVLSAIETRTP